LFNRALRLADISFFFLRCTEIQYPSLKFPLRCRIGLAQAEPSIASAVSMTPPAERMSRTPRMPRIDELPLPARNEIRAARRKERDHSHPEKRGIPLMQRLASVGLGRRAEKGRSQFDR
jgi:cell division protein FtsZ